MGCGLGYHGIRQSIANSIRLSMSAAHHLNLFRAFPGVYAWASLHICELFRDVAPGSHLRAWALWEGIQRHPTSYQSCQEFAIFDIRQRLRSRTFAPWKKSYDKARQHIKKQRHNFADKGPFSQSYGFSSSHTGKLDHKRGWSWTINEAEH